MAFADPTKNVANFDLRPGMIVADFGAGTGVYCLAMARQVMPDGKIYAVDVQKDLLERVKAEAVGKGIRDIEVIWGDVEHLGGSKIADESVEFVLISAILFQVQNKFNVALEAKRVLKPGYKVAVIDWADSFGGLGPQPADVLKEGDAKNIFLEAGFEFERSFGAGDHHYGLIFKKKK